MNKIWATIIILLCLPGVARAQETRWVTFKTGHNDWGAIAYQLDRNSVRQEGSYKIFWARIWLDQKHQPMVVNRNEALIFLSQKFAVNCAQRQFGSKFIDSNDPSQMKRKADPKTMRWVGMDKVPAVGRAVCGDK